MQLAVYSCCSLKKLGQCNIFSGIWTVYRIQVVPGRAGGGSFKRKKNYIAKKEFAYRMCARWPTIAMSKLFFRFERSFCRCMAAMSCALGWCVCDLTCFQVMWLVVRWFVVLLRYYSVLQSTTPVLLCTAKYYSVLQSTTLYYKVLRQYYASATLYCAAQQESPSNFTKYCACHAKWMSSMISVTYESSFPMRGASKVSLQPHQILRLPRKMNVIDDLRHIWKLISNAWSKSSHPPTSPNTAPATQNECQEWFASHMKAHFQCVEPVKSPPNLTKYCTCHTKSMSSVICVTYETSFPMRGASQVTLQPHQILRLPRSLEAQDLRGKSLKCFRQ